MSCVLTKGRNEISCRSNLGGLKAVYFYAFNSLTASIKTEVKEGLINALPVTLYKYEVRNGSFSETISNDENGVSYNQSLTFTLFKQDLTTSIQLNNLSKIDLGYVVEYNDKSLKIGGALNSARLNSYTIESGGSKGDLCGYNLTFESLEEYSAPFLKAITEQDTLLLEDAFNLLLEDSGDIILE